MKKTLLLCLIFAFCIAKAELTEHELRQYNNLVCALEDNKIQKAYSLLHKMYRNDFDFSQLTQHDHERLKLLAKKAWQRSLYKFEDRKDLVKYMFKLWMIFGILGCVSGTVAIGSGFSPLGVLAGVGAIGSFSASGISFGIGTLNILPWYWARNEKNRTQKFVKLLHCSLDEKIESHNKL